MTRSTDTVEVDVKDQRRRRNVTFTNLDHIHTDERNQSVDV